jgi:HPt (histidine-containing phosphotransfer) domain-containing protein
MTRDTQTHNADSLAREAVEQLLARLRYDLKPELVRDAHELLRLTSELEAAGIDNLNDHDTRWLNVRAMAHRLAGSVGSLGWERAGAAAVDLETLTSRKPRPKPAEWAQLWRQTMELVSLLDQVPEAGA